MIFLFKVHATGMDWTNNSCLRETERCNLLKVSLLFSAGRIELSKTARRVSSGNPGYESHLKTLAGVGEFG
jgi:hypothetical protein